MQSRYFWFLYDLAVTVFIALVVRRVDLPFGCPFALHGNFAGQGDMLLLLSCVY